MDDQTLIRDLRSQAIDDDLGAVVCRPQSRADDYFRLALRVAAVPASARALIDASLRALSADAADRSYAAWRHMFDLAEAAGRRQPLEPAVVAVLSDQLRVAILYWRAQQIDTALKILLDAALWPDTKPDAVAILCRTAGTMLECLDLGESMHSDPARIFACIVVLLDGMEALRTWDAKQRSVLVCVRTWLDVSGEKFRPSLKLLHGLGSGKSAADILLPEFQQQLLDGIHEPERGGHVLVTARSILESLGAPDAYRKLYRSAVDVVAAGIDPYDLFDTRLKWLATCHPDGRLASEFLARAAEFGPGRSTFLSLCSSAADAGQKNLFRAWSLQRIKEEFAVHPGHVPELAAQLSQITGDAAPNLAEARELLSLAAGLDTLDTSHVVALAELPALKPATDACIEWCRLCGAVRGRLRSPDIATWLRLALDLMKASLAWDAAQVTELVARLRNFAQLLVMSNPGCAQDAGAIMAGVGHIVNDSLLRACARNMPSWNAAAIAELRAAGLGLDLREAEIFAIRTP